MEAKKTGRRMRASITRHGREAARLEVDLSSTQLMAGMLDSIATVARVNISLKARIDRLDARITALEVWGPGKRIRKRKERK